MRDVDAVNARPWIVWTITGTFARSAAQRPMMPALLLVRVDDVRAAARGAASHEAAIRAEILDRQDRPPHLVDDLDAVAVAASPAPSASPPARSRAGDERDVVPAVVLALAGEQRVLLRPADDQARDDVDDPHGFW